MANSKRVFRGTDRAAKFFAAKREQDELDFQAIAARYHKEVVLLGDGTRREIYGAPPKPVHDNTPKPLARMNATDDDALLDLICDHQAHVVHETNERILGEQEAKQALRDRGVSFAKEPKSINAKAPSGRIGSIPKPKAPTAKPKGSDGGVVKLWDGNTAGRLPPYMNRHYGTGDK